MHRSYVRRPDDEDHALVDANGMTIAIELTTG